MKEKAKTKCQMNLFGREEGFLLIFGLPVSNKIPILEEKRFRGLLLLLLRTTSEVG